MDRGDRTKRIAVLLYYRARRWGNLMYEYRGLVIEDLVLNK